MAIPSAEADGPADPQAREETSLLELVADWYWEQDAEFRFTLVSSRRSEKGAADPFPLVGRKHWEQPALNLTEADWERHRALLAWHKPFRDFEVQHETEDGRLVWLWQSGQPVWSTDLPRTGRAALGAVAKSGGHFATFALPVPSPQGTIALLAFSGQTTREPDASFLDAVPAIGRLFGQFLQRKSAEESLRESEARFRSLTQLSSDFFWESDAEHRLTSSVHGPSYTAPIGYGLLGKTPWELPSARPEEAGWQAHRAMLESRLPFRDFEVARALPDGSTRFFAVSGQPRYDSQGLLHGYRGVGRDVTEIALARERIASLAYSDPLTGLANRVSLAPALEQAIERARRNGSKLAGVFIDLDGFKQINDRHGHAAGDAFLVEVAQRLRRH